METNTIKADLRTAQNRMFSFVAEALEQAENSGKIKEFVNDPKKLKDLQEQVLGKIFDLMYMPSENQSQWHMGIIDSGKRAIEALVSYYCPPEEKANILVSTENYVAFNKFSAAAELLKQKEVEFLKPFNLKMGQALTVDSDAELQKAKSILRENEAKTLWIAWNSTSTGVKENVEKLVEYRNSCKSDTVIICDAASLPFFSTAWQKINKNNLPDIFFFSLRKQGLPYDGPQDEANQAKNSGALYLFNDRALQLARMVDGPQLHETPRPEEAAAGKVTSGNQRLNHIKHLLKLHTSLSVFMAEKAKMLHECEEKRQKIGSEIRKAFWNDGPLAQKGFELLANHLSQSETSYIVKSPENTNPKEVVNKLKEQGIYVSISMHPKVPNTSYFRFACYPATHIEEAKIALAGFAKAV